MESVYVFAALLAFAVGDIIPMDPPSPSASTKVIGGFEASANAAPYIVSMQYNGMHFCAGSIINNEWILTAAHCLNRPANSIVVIAGIHRVTDKWSGQLRNVDIVKIHPNYGRNVGPQDIGLIHVNKPFAFNSVVKPIKLPQPGKIHRGTATLFGWGKISNNEYGSMPTALQTVSKPIIDYETCEKILGGPGQSTLHRTNLCTGPLYGGISACNGDSGGPLIQKNEQNEDELIGIVSWGYVPCGLRNSPSIYTRVSAFIDWIWRNQ